MRGSLACRELSLPSDKAREWQCRGVCLVVVVGRGWVDQCSAICKDVFDAVKMRRSGHPGHLSVEMVNEGVL